MSKVTLHICDIKDCRNEAAGHYPVMLVCHQEGKNRDGSYKIYTEENVDICGKHDLEYRRALPDMDIERKEK